MISRYHIFLCCLAAASSAGLGFASSKQRPLKNPLPLTQIALVADLDAPIDKDDPGTGGAFDTSAYFQNKLADAAAISVCIDQIEISSSGWAKEVGLTKSFEEKQPSSLSLQYVKADLPGIFAIYYDVSERIRARVRVDFYRLDGSKQPPEAAQPILTTYRIAAFQDALDKALQCKVAKP